MTTPLPEVSEAWVDALFNAVVSDAKACGWFDRVNAAEPMSAPGHGLSAAVWIQAGPNPVGTESGLDKASGLVIFNVRIYTPLTAAVRDEIDPKVTKAVSALFRRWHDNYDFGLNPMVRNVDIFGQAGVRLDSRAGYVEVSGQMCRVMTITLPVIVNDIWTFGS
jgi:hypothetical protein